MTILTNNEMRRHISTMGTLNDKNNSVAEFLSRYTEKKTTTMVQVVYVEWNGITVWCHMTSSVT